MKMDVRKTVGLNTRLHRLERGLSQAMLATRIGVDQSYISKLEAGQQNPTVLTVSNICNALDVDLRDIFAPFRNFHTKPGPADR